MFNEPLISVVMPAYNVEQYISESMESVIGQTYKNWELIVVDDGSTDGTAAVIKQYQLANQNIKYIYQQNGKQSKAKSNAIKHSTGEYIAFLDADDMWLPNKLEISVREIQSGSYDLLFTDTYYFNDGEDYAQKDLKTLDISTNIYSGKTGTLAFLETNRIPNLTVVAKKEILIKAGDFIEIAAAEEYEMWLRLLAGGAVFRAIDTPLSVYRLRNGSLTAKDRLAIFETMIVIKAFAKQHTEYALEVQKKLRTTFKYWLYNGFNAGNNTYRSILPGIYPVTVTAPLYLLSFVIPFKYLRKISNHILA